MNTLPVWLARHSSLLDVDVCRDPHRRPGEPTGGSLDSDPSAWQATLYRTLIEPRVKVVVAQRPSLGRTWTKSPRVPLLTVGFVRQVLTRELKRLMHDNLVLGLALEGMGASEYFPKDEE